MNPPFGARLREVMDRFGPLCVGIDPTAQLVKDWGYSDTARGVREVALRVVDAAAGRVGVIKPQVAFFERFGSEGFAVLQEVIAQARSADLLVIADGKRGDISSTMEGYLAAWLGTGSPLEADAVTLSPYPGVGAFGSSLRSAILSGKGAFVLAATSNPEGLTIQQSLYDGQTVARRVATEIHPLNAGIDGLGSAGVVIGATIDREAFGLDNAVLRKLPILGPGFGAQGATPGDLPLLFGAVASQVLASESRSIVQSGARDVADTISSRAVAYREAVGV